MGEEITGDIRKYMNKKYLGSWDVPKGEDLILTIKKVWADEVESQRGKEKKPMLFFKEDFKPLILNSTNLEALKSAYGTREGEKLKGKRIAIYTTKVTAFGGMTDALRIRPYAPRTEEFICEECGSVISDTLVNGKTFRAKAIANNALTKYGRYLCYDCVLDIKKDEEV